MSVVTDDDMLKIVEKTNQGTSVTNEQRDIIQKWFNESSVKYQAIGGLPLEDEYLYGNYDVSYVDPGKRQSGNPAGGRFRGSLGRFLYRNDGLFQHIIKIGDKTSVINFIIGKLFNIIPLAVILKGVVTKLPDEDRQKFIDKYRTALSSTGTVRADFDSPIIAIGLPNKAISLRVGPKSYVVLDTPYLTPQLRLGLGSRGSRFVFKRTNHPLADLWKDYLNIQPIPAFKAGTSLVTVGIVGLASTVFLSSLQQRVPRFVKIVKGVLKATFSLTTAVGMILLISRGGIERE